ncbi:MAG: transglutaminase domain-containing protein, partial [Polyangiaceae bacterium]|nr:transglutaminase domain-containing protein [Polyangiaceae bacterium]
FEARRGHCEYFSTAMAVMLRTLGVPTRNVTGFVGGELNRYGRYYALRNGDAHSWVEVHIDGRWRAFDPTPSAAREAAGGSSNGNVRAFLDALRVRWARSVVGYDLRSQAELLRSTLALVRGIRSSTASTGAGPTFTERARAAGPSGAVQLVGGSVAVAIVGLAFFVLARRRRAGRGEPDVVRLERALESAMARLGCPRAPEETPLAWAEALRAAGAPYADVAGEVVAAYAQERYGGRPMEPARARELERRVRRLPRRPVRIK